MVDIEKLLVAYIRTFDIDAFTDLPEGATRPVARVNLLGGLPENSNSPVWRSRPTVQVDVWGTTKKEAWDTIWTIRTALLEMPRVEPSHEAGDISQTVAEWPADLPDADWPDQNGQPGPRYSMTVRFVAHPART